MSFAKIRLYSCLLLIGVPQCGHAQIRFQDVARAVGIFEAGRRTPSWLDFNNDGLPDLFLGSGDEGGLLLQTHQGRFVDVSRWTDMRGNRYTHATGDIDNDGDLDIFAAGFFARPALLVNKGDGTFADLAAAAGVLLPSPQDDLFVTGSTFADVDNDGDLDLFTGNERGRDTLFRNQGDGTFADVTAAAGLDRLGGVRMTAFGDFDNDGWLDLYAATSVRDDIPAELHEVPNALYRNNGDGTFVDIALAAGIRHGPREIDGVLPFDFDNDGFLDLLVTAAGAAPLLLYRNNGDLTFAEVGAASGLARDGGSGDAIAGDFDNDGFLDLYIASRRGGTRHLLYRNNGDGTFGDVALAAGLAIQESAARLSAGDYDRDGFLDVLQANFTQSETLYRNQGNANHWLSFELVGIQSNRSAIGARVRVVAGALSMWRQRLDGNGYSSNSPHLHFGLGDQTRAERVEIHWPSGQVSGLENVAADQHIRVVEGVEGYVIVEPTAWVAAPDDAMVAGLDRAVRAVLRPALWAPDARITAVVADLSQVGGPARVPLADRGDGTYALQAVWAGSPTNGRRMVQIQIEQATALGMHRVALWHPVVDLPPGDLAVSSGWTRALLGEVEDAGGGLRAAGRWFVDFAPAQPVVQTGYQSLDFRFRAEVEPGTADRPLTLFVNNRFIALWVPDGSANQLDLGSDQWQQVSVSLDEFKAQGVAGPIERLRFNGAFAGRLQIDDVRLVAAQAPPAPTAVAAPASPTPAAPQLGQNYPNPFNGATAIPFAVSRDEEVELLIYNLAGQALATLVRGRPGGGVHTAYWDGRDRAGRPVASGLYLYRLRAGARAETRKLLLLR